MNIESGGHGGAGDHNRAAPFRSYGILSHNLLTTLALTLLLTIAVAIVAMSANPGYAQEGTERFSSHDTKRLSAEYEQKKAQLDRLQGKLRKCENSTTCDYDSITRIQDEIDQAQQDVPRTAAELARARLQAIQEAPVRGSNVQRTKTLEDKRDALQALSDWSGEQAQASTYYDPSVTSDVDQELDATKSTLENVKVVAQAPRDQPQPGNGAPSGGSGTEGSGGASPLAAVLLLMVLAGGAYHVVRRARGPGGARTMLRRLYTPMMASVREKSLVGRQVEPRTVHAPQQAGEGRVAEKSRPEEDEEAPGGRSPNDNSEEPEDKPAQGSGPEGLPPDEPPPGPEADSKGPSSGLPKAGTGAEVPTTDAPRQIREGLSSQHVSPDRRRRGPKYPMLKRFATDMIAEARRGAYDQMVGRPEELEQLAEILSRRKVSNAALVGLPGTGKTSIVEGLAQRIAVGRVPTTLRESIMVQVDLAGMVAGTKYRGEFEERLTNLLDEIRRATTASREVRSVILFIDELHIVAGAGAAEGSMDAANILKPALARGEIKVIGATTESEYRISIEKDGALKRRFERVSVRALSEEETVEILGRVKGQEETHHGVRVEDSALSTSARLAARYISEQALPASALNLLATACSRAALRGEGMVTQDTVAKVVSRQTGVPVGSLTGCDRERIQHLGESLRAKVIGQEAVVEAVAAALRRSYAGVRDPDRPVGSFLFLGPTGVGKSQTAKELARQVYGGEQNMVRIDMSEYQEQHSISRLIGAPPGYVGHEEAGQLTESIRQRPHGVILLDEVEKAHPKVWDVLLQLLDDGRLTDSQGRTVDFRNTVVIMTSNMGSREIGEAAWSGRPLNEKAVREMLIRHGMRPELPPRVDRIAAFSPLSHESVRSIARLEIARLSANLESEHGAKLRATDAVVGWVAEQGYDPAEGARPLRKVISAHIQNRLADLILEEGLGRGDVISVDLGLDGEVVVERRHSGRSSASVSSGEREDISAEELDRLYRQRPSEEAPEEPREDGFEEDQDDGLPPDEPPPRRS